MLKRMPLILMIGFFLLLPVAALADSISPSSFSTDLAIGESVTIEKTVTVDAGTPTTSKVDVFFLADSTGSMGSVINSVKTSASTILTSAASLGDVAFGAGEYRDVGDSFVYRTNTDITTNTAAVQTGINEWFASGGGDFAEANLYALEQVANTASWRDASTRILVWFGDAPSHDPVMGSTEASATAALLAENITVQALDVGSLDSLGQATRITDATGGELFTGINSAGIVDAINDSIEAVFAEYNTVSLDMSEVPAGVDVSVAPGAYSGDYTRETSNTFGFQVTFTGESAGDYAFNIYATVDGGRVALESDRITVDGTSVPEPSSMFFLGAGLLGLGVFRKKLLNK